MSLIACYLFNLKLCSLSYCDNCLYTCMLFTCIKSQNYDIFIVLNLLTNNLLCKCNGFALHLSLEQFMLYNKYKNCASNNIQPQRSGSLVVLVSASPLKDHGFDSYYSRRDHDSSYDTSTN
jgi:hypothetical protein